MKTNHIRFALALAALFVVPVTVAAQAKSDALPAGVTPKMIADGEALFKGAGTCFACHGQEAKGVPNLGADLTDKEWVHGDGSYKAIVKTITEGTQAKTGAVMPPKGGGALTDAQVKAVAAYVWSLSHGK
ncbi:MAG: c-type cytochrome [Gemmatimonadales bacterium]